MSKVVLENIIQLPQGWVTCTLADIVEDVLKINPKEQPNVEFQYCDIDSIDNNSLGIVNPKKHLGKNAPSRARQLIHTNDVLFSTVRTYLHNIASVSLELDNQLCSTGFCVLRSSDLITDKLIFYLVQTIQFEQYLSPLQRGTSYPAVRNKDILNYAFQLPPLNEQKRIVKKIEELFSKLGHTQENLGNIKEKLKQNRQSLLKSIFEGELTQKWRSENKILDSTNRWNLNIKSINDENLPKIPNEWCWRTLEQISDGVVVSFVGPTSKHYVKENKGIMFLRSQNVRKGKINFQGMKYVNKKFHEKEKKSQIKPTNLLIVRVGANRGDSCIVPNDFPMSNAGNIIIARVFEDISYLLNHYFQTNFCQKQMIGMTTGSAQGVINTTSVSQTLVPIPSLNEQEEMIRIIELDFSLIENIEKEIDSALFQLKSTRSSILKHAFEGKLVPQDPNDESAEILLQKIKQEKEQLRQKEKSKKRKKNVK